MPCRQRIARLVLSLIVVAQFGASATTSMVRAADLRTFDDANLLDVQFIDKHEGWAVGELGTVWHKVPGDDLWERQPTGIRATLTSIHMNDYRIGWISARESVPYSKGSAGLILATRNGGGKWAAPLSHDAGNQVAPNTRFLPAIRKVHFVDERHGWAVGETFEQHPGGLFFTNDGARSWIASRGTRYPGWTTLYMADFTNLFVAGRDRSFVNLREGVALPMRADWMPDTTIRDIDGSGRRIWAVGDQAQLMQSNDQGQTWQRPKLGLPAEVAKVWDFRGVSAVGDNVWVIGRPGSVVLHSSDAGKSWTMQPTGQSLPMHAIDFVDATHGWAVGDLGTILATKDGGQHWEIQQPRSYSATQRKAAPLKRRAAILWLARDGADVPLSVVARYGAEKGLYNVALALTAPYLAESLPGAACRPGRFADAFRAAGGAAAETSWRFPITSATVNDPVEKLIRHWDRWHEGKTPEEIERELVLAIRMWRPSVIATEAMTVSPSNPVAAAIVAMGARRAFETANDPTVFPEQIEILGLSPHAALKLYADGDGVATPNVRLSAADFGVRSGESYADLADAGMALGREQFVPAESQAAFVLVDSRVKGAVDHKSLVTGIGIRNDDRRLLLADNTVDVAANQLAARRAAKKRNLLAITNAQGIGIEPDQLLANLGEATVGLDSLRAGQVVFQIGRRQSETGNWDFAHGTFAHLVTNYPEHPLALPAYRWLIAYHASTEARLRSPKAQVIAKQRIRFVKPIEGAKAVAQVAGGAVAVEQRDADRRWNANAVLYGERLRTASGHLYSDPAIRMCMAAAERRLGHVSSSMVHYDAILHTDPQSRWATAIAQEKWFFEREGDIPRLPAWSVPVQARPHLDGVLDESCWTTGKRLRLSSGDEVSDKRFATVVSLRHDAEYLYVSADCRIPDPSFHREKVKRTSHDAVVDANDRIELIIDVDRDYSTFYRLAIDQRGLVADECWGDKTWDPTWYVATTSDQSGWRVEAAIPLATLTDASNLTNETWAFNVMRIVPGESVLGWTRPAATAIRPDGFSHLKFARRAPRKNAQEAN